MAEVEEVPPPPPPPPGGIPAIAMACKDKRCDFKPMSFMRRPVGDYDVLIDMKYCGVCHSDVHQCANEWSLLVPTTYPCVPGHELAGVCTAVGPKVTQFRVGDHVGVGCMVDSCLNCAKCKEGNDHMCTKGRTGTYQAKDKHGRAGTFPQGGRTIGGYSTKMVIHERFAIKIPPSYPLECAGPVMCAGITMYEPLKVHQAGPGTTVGIVGLGGLGVMGVRIATAMGCRVTAISRSCAKEELAKRSGAVGFIASSDEAQMKAAAGTFDLILSTAPGKFDYRVYEKLLNSAGKLVLLGADSTFVASMLAGKMKKNYHVCMSMIGSIANTSEVLQLCDKHSIRPEVKVVPVQEVNSIFETLSRSNDSGVRYVLDIAGSLNEETTSDAPPPNLAHSEPAMRAGEILRQTCRMLMSKRPQAAGPARG